MSKLIKNGIGDLRERQNRLFHIFFMPIEPGEVHFGPMATRFMTFLTFIFFGPFFLIDHRAEGLFAGGPGGGSPPGSSRNLVDPKSMGAQQAKSVG